MPRCAFLCSLAAERFVKKREGERKLPFYSIGQRAGNECPAP